MCGKSDGTDAEFAGAVGSHDHLVVFEAGPAVFGALVETGAGHDHALRLIVVSAERTVAQHAIVARLLATTVLVVDFDDALGSDLTAGRAQGDELVLAWIMQL